MNIRIKPLEHLPKSENIEEVKRRARRLDKKCGLIMKKKLLQNKAGYVMIPVRPVKHKTKHRQLKRAKMQFSGTSLQLLNSFVTENKLPDNMLGPADKYPGFSRKPQPMAVLSTTSGNYSHIYWLLRNGFCNCDRVYLILPWGNYVIFGCSGYGEPVYYISSGNYCNTRGFCYLDLTTGTAGFYICESLHETVSYLLRSAQMPLRFHSCARSVKSVYSTALMHSGYH